MYYKKLALTLIPLLILTGCSSKTVSKENHTDDSEESAVSSAQQEFDQMIDELFYEDVTESGLTLHSMLADPTAYGITEFPATLGDYSLEGIKEYYTDLEQMYDRLQKIDRNALSTEQKLDYDILECYLETEQTGKDFYLYEYPFSSVSGLQVELPIILAEYLFREQQDVDNYLSLLSDIDECYEQLLGYVQAQKEAGIYLSDMTIDGIIDSCQVYLDSPETGMLAETFASRLDTLPELTEEERSAYLAKNEEILKQDFTDAYTLLTEGLEELKGHMELPIGVCNLPNGREYYEYLLKSTTYTSYESPEAVRDAITDRMQKEITGAYELLSHDSTLYRELRNFEFSISDPVSALDDLQEKLLTDFPEVPKYPYEIRQVPESLEDFSNPAFYLTPPIDSQEENFIYINQADIGTQVDLYPVMAHEGYPGHLYQCNYFNSVNNSKLRALMSFSCYVEGWATYVEYYSYRWDRQISEELAQVLAADGTASLALYALVDYEVNYEGMNIEDLAQVLKESFGITDSDAVTQFYQIVCEDPANYMKYYMGYLEIMELKEEAQEVLEEDFDLKEFHTFLLDFGPAPFTIIRQQLYPWIAQQFQQQ